MNFMPEVQTAGDGDHWSSNYLVFATQEEAQAYVDDLEFRWTAVRATRVVWSNKPVNSRWDGERRQRVESGPDAVA